MQELFYISDHFRVGENHPKGSLLSNREFLGLEEEREEGRGQCFKNRGREKRSSREGEEGGLIAQKSCPIKLYPAGGGGGILSHSRRSGGGGWRLPIIFPSIPAASASLPLLSLSTTGKRKGEENRETKGAKIPFFLSLFSSHAFSFPLFGFYYIALSLPSLPFPSLA